MQLVAGPRQVGKSTLVQQVTAELGSPVRYASADEPTLQAQAFVASAPSPCVRCGNEIEVVCIYCKSGVDTEIGDPIVDFTVFNIWTMDGVLAKLIERWPHYRQGVGEDAEEGVFANHCPHCGAMQGDYLLHSEPGDVFFALAMDTPGAVEFTALEGRVCLSGDYGFGM